MTSSPEILRRSWLLTRKHVQSTIEHNPWLRQTPTPKQLLFLSLAVPEAFYGGAAGGGKSSALLMAALQFVEVPGYAALILRRSYTDLALPGALMDRAHQWLGGTAATWNAQTHTWTFPSGATLTFGYCEHENDVYRYQGSEFQCICFDELTQFTESQYRYLFSRLRRLHGINIPLRMRSASNPGGVGHEWVKRRFLIEGKGAGRIFVPARLDDNPHLDREEYIRSLAMLDPITREQLLNGDWSARRPGGMFRREWFGIVDALPAHVRMVRYWDLAATADGDWTAGCKAGLHDGVLYIADMRRMRGTPAQVEALVRQTAELDGRGVTVYIEQEPGASGANTIDHYRRHVLPGWAVYGIRTTGSKLERAQPLSSMAEAGNVKLSRGTWITDFLDELEAFPYGAYDDQVDAASGALMQLAARGPLLVEI